MSFLATDCARARESVSVQLDGELPEFDLDRLETHLRICPACAAWAEEVRDVTQRLREAALEVPEAFVLPQGTRRWTVSSALALASAAAVVATLFVAPHPQHAAVGLQYRGGTSRFSSAARHVFEARTVPLEDGVFTAVSVNTLNTSFRPV